jgi:hypothetical protein
LGEDIEKTVIVEEAVDSLDMIENMVVVVDHKTVMTENVVDEILIPRREKIMVNVRVNLNHNGEILGKGVVDRGRGGTRCDFAVGYFNSVECALFTSASGHFFWRHRTICSVK